MNNEQENIKSIIKENAKTFIESDNVELNGEQLDLLVVKLNNLFSDRLVSEKMKIYSGLMKVAEAGEYEDLRREVEIYFNPCKCDQ